MKVQELPKSLNFLVQKLKNAIEEEGRLTPLKAGQVVKEANVNVEDMMTFADFDHPVEDCYGRKMVYDNGNFEVMVMSWNPDHFSSIHNHGYTQWGVVQVFGHVFHMVYHIKDNELRFSRKEILPSGGIVKVNNQFIHQMGNASTGRYLTLHVYGCNDRDENITADAENYDLEFDRISHTTGGAFFNLPDSEIYDFEEGPKPTKEVFLHYANLLLTYYSRQPQTEKMILLQKNLLAKMRNRIFREEKMETELGVS